MDDNRKVIAVASPPVERHQKPLALVQGVPWLIVILLMAACAFLAWKAFGPRDYGDPVAASLTAFEKQNSLTVFSAQLAPVVSSEDERFFGMVESRQIAVIPARVDYTLDLSAMDAGSMTWDKETATLAVQLPALTLSQPNLDEGNAQYLREGIWISREAQDKLTRDNTRLAEQIATQQAGNRVLMDLAHSAARDAIRQNLAIPLQVAGFGDVTINVRFDGEEKTP